MDEEPQEVEAAEDGDRPALWNPNAAANWSLLLTPAFGAFLHAANWRVLGKPVKALANLAWVAATIVFLLANAATLFLLDTKGTDAVMRVVGLGLLLGWYFTQGKSQARYLNKAFPEGYEKKRWGKPLGIGFGCLAAYAIVLFVLGLVTYRPTADDVVAEVKPLILQEWGKKPELRGATIQNISLTHKEGKVYTGFVDAILDGQAERLALEVVYEGGMVRWELRPVNRQ